MKTEKETTLKFLSNEPIGADLFAGKSQEKTAEVISQILEDKKFQILGIDGSWGTGKSNLVKILDNKLPNHKFFIYDVWGHQEDDQRKSILIELTDFILDKNNKLISNTTIWKSNLKKLLGKEREITTINRPYLSIGFIFSLFSIIYIPTVNTFKDNLDDFLDIESIFWKFILVIFPILIVLGIYIFNVVNNWLSKKGFCYSFKLAAQQTFQVYTNKQEQETKIETISESEPTVRDFTKWTNAIDQDLKTNKLVVVFDNFDRLPKKHILNIWSSLHVLFSEKKYENIKVIVPFDRDHIRNAFKEMNGEQHDYADDYINKTFDLVYRVSAPILSDWKDFFKSKWKEANSEYDEKEYLQVIQAYEVYRPQITPREIIAFINEVIAIKMLDKSIPDRYISIFILHKKHILNNPLSAITDLHYLYGLKYLFDGDEDFQKYITALAYQISSDNSLEVIYRKQLKNALINKETSKFKEIAGTNIFGNILRTVLREEIIEYSNPIEVLNTIDESAKITKFFLQEIWDDIYKKIMPIRIEQLELKNSHLILLEKISPQYKNKWIGKLINDFVEVKEFDTVKYASIIDELNTSIEKQKIDFVIYQHLPEKNVEEKELIELVKAVGEKSHIYNIYCDENKLNSYLSSFKDSDLEDINYLQYIPKEYDLTLFGQSLIERVNKNKNNSKIIGEISRLSKICFNEIIDLSISDDTIYNFFSATSPEESFYFDLLALRLIIGSSFHPNYNSPFNKVLQNTEEDIIEKVSNSILHFIRYDDLLINSISFSSSDLNKEIVRFLVENDHPKKKAYVNEILKNFDEICEANSLIAESLIRDLNSFDYEKSDLEFIKLSIGFYEIAHQLELSLCKDCVDGLINHFNNYDKSKWIDVFRKPNLDSFKRVKAINYSDWNSFAIEALEFLLLEIIEKNKLANTEVIGYLVKNMNDVGQRLSSTFKNVRDNLISTNRITPEIFLFLSEWLFDFSSLKEKASDSIRTIFKPSILDNDSCLKILSKRLADMSLVLDNAGNEERDTFNQAIKSRAKSESIKNLAASLKIDID
ncbi:P-loop NTPase fold protein [Belliella sp. R4-6]|uniref:P-loop NTPase fold protein n=1 Tax=Belliella alkalica TaxID=1730871 RepID=A0ABS9VHE8_9BACT|nr:P-loop NTPase fold protein [Belliella alkalica]MCH7415865.1 P-loop NTPase fold protein [Belliella alkalica]